MQLVVDVNIRPVLRAHTAIRTEHAPKATMAALRRARNTARTHTVRRAARTLGARQRRLRTRILKRLQRNPTRSKLSASFVIGTFPVPIEELGRAKQTGAGVQVGRLPLQAGAFVATMPSGHTGVYQRYGGTVIVNTTAHGPRRKQRIAKVTYDIGPVVRASGREALRKEGATMFRRRFEHEIRRRLARFR